MFFTSFSLFFERSASFTQVCRTKLIVISVKSLFSFCGFFCCWIFFLLDFFCFFFVVVCFCLFLFVSVWAFVSFLFFLVVCCLFFFLFLLPNPRTLFQNNIFHIKHHATSTPRERTDPCMRTAQQDQFELKGFPSKSRVIIPFFCLSPRGNSFCPLFPVL